MITHFNGERLDFGLGRTLGTNYGIVAAGKDVHGRVLEAIKQANANGVNYNNIPFHILYHNTHGQVGYLCTRHGTVIEWQCDRHCRSLSVS